MNLSSTGETMSNPLVLLIDDDPEALEELAEILELEDIPTISVSTIEEAYGALSAHPDLAVVVTDVHLVAPCGEKTNGIDFVALAGRRFAERKLSFVVLSGDADAVGRSFETGAVDFLTKPLVPDALVLAVRRAFESRGEVADVASALLRKVEETTKSLQQATADLADRELQLSASREEYDRRRMQGSKLKRAIDEHQIMPWFQPQVCLRTGRLLGFEALVRWIDPVHGARNPSKFIPLAHEVGLIAEVGFAMQRQSFATMAMLRRAELPPMTISINMTAEQLSQPDFADTLALEVECAGLALESMSIEVLESAMLSDDPNDPIKGNVARLRQLGIGVELDDFGTGHAALSSLRDLEVTCVKIDRSFVHGVHADEKLQMFTRALISLAKALRIEVLAEGVEHSEDLAWLIAENCDAVQGYLIARPMPAEDLLDWAKAWQGLPALPKGANAA